MKIIPDGPEQWARKLEALGWTCHRPGQSCVGTNHAYVGKQDTSYGASVYVLPKTGTQRREIYDWLRHIGPATDPELQRSLHLGPNSERPRRVELVEGGFVEDSGMRKKHHGEEHIVWRAVPR